MGEDTRLVCQVGLTAQEAAERLQGQQHRREPTEEPPVPLQSPRSARRRHQGEEQREDTNKAAASALMRKIRG